jgi:hypothetical protein
VTQSVSTSTFSPRSSVIASPDTAHIRAVGEVAHAEAQYRQLAVEERDGDAPRAHRSSGPSISFSSSCGLELTYGVSCRRRRGTCVRGCSGYGRCRKHVIVPPWRWLNRRKVVQAGDVVGVGVRIQYGVHAPDVVGQTLKRSSGVVSTSRLRSSVVMRMLERVRWSAGRPRCRPGSRTRSWARHVRCRCRGWSL